MSDTPRIRYTPRPDATREVKLAALTACYRFVLDCHAKKIAAEPNDRNDAAIVRNTEGMSHVDQRPG